MNIAIDGPAGAGKSTVAKMIAEKLNLIYVDTGAMYRAVGLYFYRRGIPAEDEASVNAEIDQVRVTIGYENGQQQVYLNDENVTSLLRTEMVSHMSSAISVYPAVRRKMVQLQQQLGAEYSVVMDGRDIGTVVLPQAELKIFLTADLSERANRRFLEYQEKGTDCDLKEIERDLAERDYRDSHRSESPLKKAEDAVVVDSTNMTAAEVSAEIERLYHERESGAFR